MLAKQLIMKQITKMRISLCASLLGNILIGKGTIKTCEGRIRAGEGTIRASKDF